MFFVYAEIRYVRPELPAHIQRPKVNFGYKYCSLFRKYRTSFGALISIIIVLGILGFSFYRLFILFSKIIYLSISTLDNYDNKISRYTLTEAIYSDPEIVKLRYSKFL